MSFSPCPPSKRYQPLPSSHLPPIISPKHQQTAHSMNHLTHYEEANVSPVVAASHHMNTAQTQDPNHDSSSLWSPATTGRGFSDDVRQHLEHFYYQQPHQRHHYHQHLPPPQDQRFLITSNHFLRTRSYFRLSPPHLRQQLSPTNSPAHVPVLSNIKIDRLRVIHKIS